MTLKSEEGFNPFNFKSEGKSKPIKATELLRIYKSDEFDIALVDYFLSAKKGENKLSKTLNAKDKAIRLTDVTYRQLNSWDSQGLLTSERENREWRKFSIIDAIWIKIIQELREFGIPWDKIKTAKDSLSVMSDDFGAAMPLLEFYTAFAITKNMPVIIFFFKDGVAMPANFLEFKNMKGLFDVENHLQISLNGILKALFPKLNPKSKAEFEIPVSLSEMELLEFLRVGNYENIQVKFKNGEMEHFEGLERHSAKSRIKEILEKGQYQDISITQQDGQITAILSTTKKKFTKGKHPK